MKNANEINYGVKKLLFIQTESIRRGKDLKKKQKGVNLVFQNK